MKKLVAEMSGHCRALEMLYQALESIDKYSPNYWGMVATSVASELRKRYHPDNYKLDVAIAYSFLSIPIFTNGNRKYFIEMEEQGLCKIDENNRPTVPFVFATMYMSAGNLTCSRLWYNISIAQNLWWQEWEIFNMHYFAFQLSLFAFIEEKTISVEDLFRGAIYNGPKKIQLMIPTQSEISYTKLDYQYPTTKCPKFSDGRCVLNGSGAAFDGFCFLNRFGYDEPILLAFQMKLANENSKSPQIITNKVVDEEYSKVNRVIGKQDFILVLFGRCEAALDIEKLPSKCVIISRKESRSYYGPDLVRRLFIDELEPLQ
jgi:hypothetical protein